MYFKKKLLLFLLLVVFLNGCQNKGKFHLATFENPVEVKINRFDLDFIALDTSNLAEGLQALELKYPTFYPLFLSDILMMQPNDTLANTSLIMGFLKDTIFIKVHQDVKSTFESNGSIEDELSTAYSYLSHYFPDIQLPEIYFFVSGFNRQLIQNKSLLGVGSDLYLGANYPIYKDITHEYLTHNMRKEMLVTDILSTILHNEFNISSDINLLNSMIYEGKILFLLNVFMPNTSTEDITGFSTEDLGWCKSNEKHVWETMVANKDLFSKDPLLINQYINNAPFTSPISQTSPGRLGVWIGWQIVRSYMENNKQINLNDLMSSKSDQAILEKSMYRP